MAFKDTTWYVNYGNGSNTGYYAVPVWPGALSVVTAGTWCRQLTTPAVGAERCYVCIAGGTTGAAEPSWVTTRGADTGALIDGSVTWQECTGMPGPCGDLTNSNVWLDYKNTAVSLGALIYDSVSGSLQLCKTAGTAGNGSAPSFSATAGTTTADNTVTWVSLGATSNYTTPFKYPHARLQAACASTWAAAGNSIYVSNNHAETQAALMVIPVGASTMANIFKIICVNDSAAPPTALATTATVTVTGTFNLQINPFAYIYGIIFTCGTGSSATSLFHSVNTSYQLYVNCTFALASTSASSLITQNSGNATASYNEYLNCAFIFAATGQKMQLAWNSIFRSGCTFAASGSVPTTLFSTAGSASRGGKTIIRDCDLSAVTGTLVDVTGGQAMDIFFQNCKLGAAVAASTGTPLSMRSCRVHIHNSDSANTNYRTSLADYPGTISYETTIVRTGSRATDGVTPISWAMVTTANATFFTPLVSEEITLWNELTGAALTLTLYLISNTTLNNNDAWADVEYSGTASYPQGVISSSRMVTLATPVALTSDTSTWGGSTNKYKISLTFTPNTKGLLTARFYQGKASATTYIDPVIYLADANGNQKSIGRSFFVPGFGYVNETAPSFMRMGMGAING